MVFISKAVEEMKRVTARLILKDYSKFKTKELKDLEEGIGQRKRKRNQELAKAIRKELKRREKGKFKL